MENFIADALALAKRRMAERPITSIRQAQQLLTDAAAELHETVVSVPASPQTGVALVAVVPWEDWRQGLLEAAAICLQAAAELGIDSRQDAIGKAIPW
jgi:hypothetical protein